MNKFDIKRKKARTTARVVSERQRRKKRLMLGILIPLALLAAVLIACLIYVNIYYRADGNAVAAFETQNPVLQKTLEDGTLVFEPMDPVAGLIFYPGGKVEAAAYTPLMQAMADRGILCILVEMPARLAVLDADAARGMQELYPAVDDWYIGGHSLGGSMAAKYLSENATDFAGLLLLGSYSTADLSDTALSVLSIIGSEDGVLNRDKYESCREYLPEDTEEVVIEGGCHAYFGMYGAQRGDGTPRISPTEQIHASADAFLQHVLQRSAAE